MKKVYFIGLDIAKNVFQLFLADEKGRQIGNRKMTRNQMIQCFSTLPPCIVGIEACGTAHHWARTLGAMGHTVKLIQPIRVKAFLGQRNKTDAADAKAICEALMHPGTVFVRVKSLEQQDMDHLLDRRQRLIEERTRIVNQTRAFLAERGIIIPQGIENFKKAIPQICSEYWDSFSGAFQAIITDNFADFQKVADEVARLDDMIKSRAKDDMQCEKLMSIPGIGPLTATALVSQVNDGKQFENGRQMAAYIGITPKEHSSGGKQHLLGITKRGNRRLRTLLILAARSIITGIGCRKKDENGIARNLSKFDIWVLAMKERLGIFKAAVAIANKLARIAWAVLARNEEFVVGKAIKNGI